jgi:hypothetical protein
MEEPTSVDFSVTESPTGDSSDGSEVVSGQQSEQLVPKQDLDNLRSVEQKRYRALEKQYRETQQQLAQQQLESQKEARYAQVSNAWYQQYLAQGHDAATARHHATTNARKAVDAEFEQTQLKSKLETYEQKEIREQYEQAMTDLGNEVMELTGLSEDQLKQAIKGLSAKQPNFVNEVWKRALAFKQTAGKQDTAASARDLRNRTPIPSGSATPQAVYQGLPHNIQLGSDQATAIINAEKVRRRSQG